MAAANITPPPVLDGARVLAYAIMDDSVVYTGCSTLYVDGKALGAVPRLAVCQNSDANDVLLLFCDEKWNSLGVTECASLEEARQQAEVEYRGVSDKWVDMNVSEEEAERYLEEHWNGQLCSFCGKRPDQVERMLQSPGARICNECVEAFHYDLKGDRVRS